MNENRKVRRYWMKDINTNSKELTAITKSFDIATSDISSVLGISKREASFRLLRKGCIESKHQAWILLSEVTNPFSTEAKKTPL